MYDEIMKEMAKMLEFFQPSMHASSNVKFAELTFEMPLGQMHVEYDIHVQIVINHDRNTIDAYINGSGTRDAEAFRLADPECLGKTAAWVENKVFEHYMEYVTGVLPSVMAEAEATVQMFNKLLERQNCGRDL